MVQNRYIALFREKGLPIFASRDWHPEKTSHFKSFGGIWPVHCVQGSDGAKFHPDLQLPPDAIILSKGMDPQRDDYSAFQGMTASGTLFPDILRERGISKLYVGGLATDYCVKESVLEGLRHDLVVTLLEDASRGVDLEPGDSEKAVALMRVAGGYDGISCRPRKHVVSRSGHTPAEIVGIKELLTSGLYGCIPAVHSII